MSSIRIIERILHLSKKSSSYKYALLLGIVDYIVENPFEPPKNNFHFIPLFYLAKQYLAYYFPLVLERIPQGTYNKTKLGIAIASDIDDFVVTNRSENNFNFSIESSKSINLLISFIDENNDLPECLIEVLNEIKKKIIDQPLQAITNIQNEKESFFSIITKGVSFDQTYETHRKSASGLHKNDYKKIHNWRDLLETEKTNIILSHQVFLELSKLRFWLRDVVIKRWFQESVKTYKIKNMHMITLLDYWKEVPERNSWLMKLYRQLYLDLEIRTCFYCDNNLEKNFHLDHFIPWSKFPVNSFWNLYPCCSKCNIKKRDIIIEIDDELKLKLKQHIGLCLDNIKRFKVINNDVNNFNLRKKNSESEKNTNCKKINEIIEEIILVINNLLENSSSLEFVEYKKSLIKNK